MSKDLVDLVVNDVNKDLGQGTLVESPDESYYGSSSWGLPSLDLTLGYGLPLGKYVQLAGGTHTGKSALSFLIAASYRKAFPDAPIVYFDIEDSLDQDFCKLFGLDIKAKNFYAPDTMLSLDDVYRIMDKFTKKDIQCLFVLDSMGEVASAKELDGDLDENMNKNVARASVNSRFGRQFKPALAKSKSTFLFINHILEKPGVSFGNPEYTPGGKFIQFANNTTLWLYKNSKGIDIKIKKSKSGGGTDKKIEGISFSPLTGYDVAKDCIDAGIASGILTLQGNSVYHEETKLGGSKSKAAESLTQEQIDWLRRKIVELCPKDITVSDSETER